MDGPTMSFWKIYLAFTLAIASVIVVVMVGSQATGYNLYTGDELASHVAKRLQRNLDRERNRPPTTTTDTTPTEAPPTYQEMPQDRGAQFKP